MRVRETVAGWVKGGVGGSCAGHCRHCAGQTWQAGPVWDVVRLAGWSGLGPLGGWQERGSCACQMRVSRHVHPSTGRERGVMPNAAATASTCAVMGQGVGAEALTVPFLFAMQHRVRTRKD